MLLLTSHRNLSSYQLCPSCYQPAVTQLVLYPHVFILPSHCNPSSSPTVALIVTIHQLLLSSLSSIGYLFEYYCFPCIMMNLSFLIPLTISFFPITVTSTYILFQWTSFYDVILQLHVCSQLRNVKRSYKLEGKAKCWLLRMWLNAYNIYFCWRQGLPFPSCFWPVVTDFLLN
jgi:hypothetical protein